MKLRCSVPSDSQVLNFTSQIRGALQSCVCVLRLPPLPPPARPPCPGVTFILLLQHCHKPSLGTQVCIPPLLHNLGIFSADAYLPGSLWNPLIPSRIPLASGQSFCHRLVFFLTWHFWKPPSRPMWWTSTHRTGFSLGWGQVRGQPTASWRASQPVPIIQSEPVLVMGTAVPNCPHCKWDCSSFFKCKGKWCNLAEQRLYTKQVPYAVSCLPTTTLT